MYLEDYKPINFIATYNLEHTLYIGDSMERQNDGFGDWVFIDDFRAMMNTLLTCMKARIEAGHNDTCEIVLCSSDEDFVPVCTCGHNYLLDEFNRICPPKSEDGV